MQSLGPHMHDWSDLHFGRGSDVLLTTTDNEHTPNLSERVFGNTAHGNLRNFHTARSVSLTLIKKIAHDGQRCTRLYESP